MSLGRLDSAISEGSRASLRVEMIGHATLKICAQGKSLLTDPWLVDPIVGDGVFHFPPLVHCPDELAASVDAIFISHSHPDHFHPASLGYFRRDIPIYIGERRAGRLRGRIESLGFRVLEVPLRATTAIEGTPFEVVILESDHADVAACDSALLVDTGEFSLFENNDCWLSPATYRWVGERYALDFAFLGYSPASFFPIAFEMDEDAKRRILEANAERRYEEFVAAARILGAKLSVPFASGLRYLRRASLAKNVSFNSAPEALRRLRAAGLPGDVMGPGDRLYSDGRLERVCPIYERDEELAAIGEYASRLRPALAPTDGVAKSVRAGLLDELRSYFVDRWLASRTSFPALRDVVVAFELIGLNRGRFYLDFSRADGGIFQLGTPERFDSRYTYPAAALQACLDGDIDWDELNFSDGVSVSQIRYVPDFDRMLRFEIEASAGAGSPGGDALGSAHRDTRALLP